MYHHLTLEEREVIARMHSHGCQQATIARRLKRAGSTISRELRRNHSRNGYWAVAAQKKADRRRCRSWVGKLERPEVRRYAAERLRQSWSPDQIAARSRQDFPQDRRYQLSHQTIYAWIRTEAAARRSWSRHLRSSGWKGPERENRGRLPACTGIAGRPAVVDRKSGYLLLSQLADLRAPTVRQSTAALYRPLPAALRRTLTLDNGKEFAEHRQLEAEASLKIYFADPYCAWQRGTNENTNGLIRQFFPKGTDLAKVPEYRIKKVQDLLNNRPRKRLGYRTPREVLGQRLPSCT